VPTHKKCTTNELNFATINRKKVVAERTWGYDTLFLVIAFG